MNHHYRIVWSQVSSTWVAVSELSKGHGKSAAARKRVLGALATLGLSALSMAASALDLPAGAQVTAGAATVQTPAKGAMVVNQSTQRAVIKWNDFSIAQGKQVNFAQPNASAATLNVVTGGNTSAIAGTLKANGSVYLINQNGIAITPTGVVDTRAGFIASTLRMDEAAFMGGKNVFHGKGASVVNRGQILTGPGGIVGLLGSTVANEGLISAPLGKVALGSGEAATLDLSGDGFLQLMLPASAVGADGQALVTNSGVIEADGGVVMLKASTVRQALREAVNMPGDISARSVSGKNGAIVLGGDAGGTVRVSGTLSADGDTVGGRIDVTGAHVVLEGASLSATGAERGGLVRVGGAFQGGREQSADSTNAALFAGRFGSTPVIANATTTRIDAASSIDVSATGAAGSGGTTIVWSDSTTVMQGAISARGAASGGAVEVSAKSTVQSAALSRIDLGQGGKLLIDPQNIVIDRDALVPAEAAGNYSYATPGASTHLLEADLTALLSAGTTVSLQASQDITWLDNFSFVTRTPATPGGDLNLSAGRSVTLSGTFTTADGNWNIVANDTAAHGVVDGERGAGAAEINVRDANFINSNGKLSLTLADGAGNTNREVDRISLGKFNGNALTATISPTATPAYGTTRILLTDDINVSGAISLTGNLLVSSTNSVLSLSGQSVTWTDEKSGSSISGEQKIKFIENGLTTHLGTLSYGDAVRLELDSQPGLTRVYGDSDPGMTDLTAPLLRVAAHSGSTSAADPLGDILSTGSLALSGPGVLASAGNNSVSLSATSSAELVSGLNGNSYFVDISAISVPLAITPRTVTPTVSAGTYTYGSPTAVASLAGVVNGDVLKPVATLNSTVGVTMVNNGAGFGFAETVAAGSSSFSLTGLSGAQVSSYTLDLSGVIGSTLDISQKALLTYVAGNGGQTYGSLGTMPSASLSGILAGDDVTPVVALNAAGQAVSLTDRLPAGTYATDVASLTGSKAGNYAVAATGNTSGRYTVSTKPITVSYDPAGVTSTYGTMVDLSPAVSLTGVLAGDTVVPDVRNNWLDYRTPAGNHTWTIQGLQGISSGNYSLSYSGDFGKLTINKKPISYFGAEIGQVYGVATLPSPYFSGVLSEDLPGVTAPQVVSYPPSYAPSGSGNLPVGSYQVDLGAIRGARADNYSLDRSVSTPQRVTVTPKPVGVAHMNPLASTYGTQADMSTARTELSGIVSGDSVAGQAYAYDQLRSGDNVTATTPVGTYNVALDTLSGADSANYKVADRRQSVGTLRVDPKDVTVQFTNPNSRYVYGDTMESGTVNGLVAGDIVSPVLTYYRDSSPATDPYLNVGSYRRAAALEGPNAWNYRVINGVSLIDIVPRQLAGSIAPITKEYGQPMNNWYEWVSFSNLVGNDKVQANIGYQYGYFPGSTYYVRGDTVMSDKSPAGDYTSVVTGLTGPAASNYMLPPGGLSQQIKGLLTISRKPIFYTIENVESVYGTRAVLGLGSLKGVLDGDIVNPGPTTLADGTDPANRTNAGTYNLSTQGLWGAQSGNYKLIGSAGGQLTIQRKVISTILDGFTWNNKELYYPTYGDSYRPTGAMSDSEAATYGINAKLGLSGVLQGDDVKEEVYAPNNIPFSKSGAYRAGTYTWFLSRTLTGADASNYLLSEGKDNFVNLTIKPKNIVDYVTVTDGVNNLNTAVYGTPMSLKTLGSSGVVTTPFGKDDAYFQPYITDSNNNRASSMYERQAVGNYTLGSSFYGADAANYALPVNAYAGSLYISPKLISLSIANKGLVDYGSSALPWVYSGLVPGDTLQAVSFVCSELKCGTAADAKVNLPFRAPVGYYAATVTGLMDLYGRSTANYQWENAAYPVSQSFPFTIQPRQLTWAQDAGNLSITYGNKLPAIDRYSLSGILPGDVVKSEPIATPISVAVGGAGVRRGVDTLPDAGTYAYGGVAAVGSNYVLPADGRQLTVAPKPLAYAITDVSGQYGNYKDCATPGCVPWIPGIDLGQIIVPDALLGDRLGGTIGLLNTKGEKFLLDEKTPVGNYFQVLTGLTGASAPNYVVAYSGSVPGVLSVKPMWLSYATSSAVMVGNSEFGLVGKPGVATLRGPNGTPINGDDVQGNVAMVAADGRFVAEAGAEFKNLSSPRYTFPVVGLSGKDAENYRILPDAYVSEATYGKNEIGTLDVFPDTTLNISGLGSYNSSGAATANTRLAPALPVYAPNPINTGITLANPADTARDTINAIATIATGAASALNGTEQVSVTTTAGTQTTLGDAELSANATAGASALAQYGLTGVNLVASANAGATVKVDFGPGYASAQASTQALVSAKLNPTGLTVLANAGASAQAAVGYASSTDAGRVTLGTTATANAGASGTAKAGYNNGSVGATSSGSVGAGVSVSGTAGLSGDTGSLQSTASVTSPGSLGGTGGGSVGYSNGRLRFSVEFGADIGIGGFKLKLDGEIKPEAVADFFNGDFKNAASAIGGAIGCGLGWGGCPSPPQPPTEAEKYKSKVRFISSLGSAAKYAYLESVRYGSAASAGEQQAEREAVTRNSEFLSEFGMLVENANFLKAKQENRRRIFLDLLVGDPSQAIALANAGYFDPGTDLSDAAKFGQYADWGRTEKDYASEVKAQAARWKVGITMEDGRMTFRDPK